MSNKDEVFEFNDHAYNSIYDAYDILKSLALQARDVRDSVNDPQETGISKGIYRRLCDQLDRCTQDVNKLFTMINAIIDVSEAD